MSSWGQSWGDSGGEGVVINDGISVSLAEPWFAVAIGGDSVGVEIEDWGVSVTVEDAPIEVLIKD